MRAAIRPPLSGYLLLRLADNIRGVSGDQIADECGFEINSVGHKSFGSSLQSFAQGGDGGLTIRVIEDGAGDDKEIGTGVFGLFDRFWIDPAVYFDPLIGPDSLLRLADFWQDFGHELLAGEAGDDGHNQHQVDVLKDRIDRFDRRGRI